MGDRNKVIAAAAGETVQTVHLEVDNWIDDLHLWNEQLIVRHGAKKVMLSFYTVSYLLTSEIYNKFTF